MNIEKGTKVRAWSEGREPVECYYLETTCICDFNENSLHVVSLDKEPCFGNIDAFEYVEVLSEL